MSTIQARDRILDIFVSVGVFLLVWGIILQLARVLHLNLSQLGLAATPTASALALLYLVRRFRCVDGSRLSGWFRKEEGWLLAISLVAGIVRFFILRPSSDSLQYLIGAAHHLAYPDLSLRFDMPGHYMTESQPLIGYWIPSTLEYFWAYVSLVSSIPLPTLYFRLMPAIAIVLAIFSIYCLFLSLGASRKSGFLLTLFSFCLLLLNFHDASFGEWAILRTITPRALFNAFVLNILICFVLTMYSNTNRKNILWKSLLFVSGLSLTSQTIPYLIIAAAGILLIASSVTNRLQKKDQLLFDSLLFMSFSIPAILVIAVPYIMGTPDLYQFVYLIFAELGISDPLSSFNAMWARVFSRFNWGHLAAYLGLLGLHIYLFLKYRNWINTFLLIFAGLYIVIVLNPLSFEMLKLISNKYRVYFRFYYLFPVILYPAIIFLFCWSLQKRKLISIATVLLVMVFIFFAETGFKTTKNTIANFEISSDVCFGETYKTQWLTSSLGKPVDGNLLFAYREASFRYGVFSPESILLASKHQFLPLHFSKDEALEVAWAQEALGQTSSLSETQVKSLKTVLDRYKPYVVVARRVKGMDSPAINILKESGYSFRAFAGREELYVLE